MEEKKLEEKKLPPECYLSADDLIGLAMAGGPNLCTFLEGINKKKRIIRYPLAIIFFPIYLMYRLRAEHNEPIWVWLEGDYWGYLFSIFITVVFYLAILFNFA